MTNHRLTKLQPGHPLSKLNTRLDCIESMDHYGVFMAAGAVRSLGKIVFNYHGNGVEGLNNSDMEGVGLAILSLGIHLENIATDLESNVTFIGKQAEELAGMIGKEGES